jgi:pimeloyl-ACP methyl ester carboxylesterase
VCSFVVVHDLFDTCEATAILFKPIAQRHDGCQVRASTFLNFHQLLSASNQLPFTFHSPPTFINIHPCPPTYIQLPQVLCFNYPGQAHTVWPRAPEAERKRGAVDPALNNDWLAGRLHELLCGAEAAGDVLLSGPFHLVGIGNGAAVAAAFLQQYAHTPRYKGSVRSLVSVNGFLYPDPQLAAILHASYQIFEAAPHSRPDIPVSYWSKFLFSESYLARVNPNLALNILTAVSNPITNEGRSRLAKGCLAHRDLRGALAPDFVQPPPSSSSDQPNSIVSGGGVPIQVPVVVLQSTENVLVNASNVDPFIQGRNCKHLVSVRRRALTCSIAEITLRGFI